MVTLVVESTLMGLIRVEGAKKTSYALTLINIQHLSPIISVHSRVFLEPWGNGPLWPRVRNTGRNEPTISNLRSDEREIFFSTLKCIEKISLYRLHSA